MSTTVVFGEGAGDRGQMNGGADVRGRTTPTALTTALYHHINHAVVSRQMAHMAGVMAL